MGSGERVRAVLGRLQWRRGVRAALAVLVAMLVCRWLGRPIGWAALGGFEAILVDNGGPYRSRLVTMATVLGGGAIGVLVGAWAAGSLPIAMAVTALFCFAVTYARVMAQPIASTSVIILVIYFAGYGSQAHTLRAACEAALELVLGGAWAAALSLVLWPLDPFRPARGAVAECYERLADFTAWLATATREIGDVEQLLERARVFDRGMRVAVEQARATLGETPARTTSRTVRARSLTVLLETAEMLFAGVVRGTEMSATAGAGEAGRRALANELEWMAAAERAVGAAVRDRPADFGASFAPQGSHSVQFVGRRRRRPVPIDGYAGDGLAPQVLADERMALENVEVAFEAVRALWTGAEVRGPWGGAAAAAAQKVETGWMEALQANWTADSVMARHAVRMAVVGAADVLLMRLAHVTHGSWMAMTSMIVLQPYGSGTLRKGAERVGGTVAGAVLAALLAAGVHSQAGIVGVITVFAGLTLATYAVNYAWYCFFLTPTFVLMSLPHLRDWRYAGVRVGMTVAGAAVALLAMRLLWPVGEELELGRLLARGAEAEAEYLRAVLRYWATAGAAERAITERELLHPARRRCGLALNDAEETLDRMMLEPTLGWRRRGEARAQVREEALTFATYLRRLTRSITTLAAVGDGSVRDRMNEIERRLHAVAAELKEDRPETGAGALEQVADDAGTDETAPAEAVIRRMERQVGVLERAGRALLARG